MQKRKKGGEIVFNKNKLYAKIVENGYTLREIARKMGISPSTTENSRETIESFLNIQFSKLQILRMC